MLSLFRAEFKRNVLEFIRYPAEVIVGIVILVVLFYGLFLGASFMAGPDLDFGDRLDSIIVGYVVWTMILHSMNSVAGEMQKEAQVGAMEQVFLSCYGPTRVFVNRTIADIMLTSLITLAVLFLILLLTGSRLEFSAAILPPLLSIMLGSFGLAFIMGALALYLKRVQQLLNLGQFVLLFLIMTPFETFQGDAGLARFALPIAPGTGLLRDVMARGAELDINSLTYALAGGAFYALSGILLFNYMVRQVKLKGSLGWY